MDPVTKRLHRLSLNQLRALSLLAKAPSAIISSTGSGNKLGLKGKALGGVFSSLSRQKIQGKSLVIPWGKAPEGQGLRWRLNENLISRAKLQVAVDELLRY